MRRTVPLSLLALLFAVAPVHADNVLAGVDIFVALPTSSQSFTGPYAIPGDFFNPGSEPFVGTVLMESPPPGSIPGCSLLPASPLIATRRMADAIFPGGETVPIELLQLSLVSVNPITVSYPGGVTETWRIAMSILPALPGTMTLQHEAANGGTFNAQFPVRPQFVFERTDGPAPLRNFTPDVGAGEIWALGPGPWSHLPDAGMVEIPGCTTNFFPGVIPPGPALAAAAALPPMQIGLLGPQTALDITWPVDSPTAVRESSWGRLKALYR
jgi:hypothetical protein